jgi:arabinan endo-1,5-alpha-L-arabinosidase
LLLETVSNEVTRPRSLVLNSLKKMLAASPELCIALMLSSVACSDRSEPPQTSTGGAPPASSGSGGNASGGTGSGGVAGQGGGATQGGSSGASAGAGGTTSQGGMTSLGGSSGDGPSAGAGGSSAGAGGGGTAGGGGDDDRCEIAKHDLAEPPEALTLSGNLGTHDPVLIESGGEFFLFSTGNNIGAKTSSNLTSWQGAPDVLNSETRPSWLSQQVPGVSNLWAPDISYFSGAYHLYYSASTFGSNRSCIGHLSRAALDSGSWVDHGPVLCSNVSSDDNWNAIDPNVIVDREGKPWLSFGSFWSGIKLIELDEQGARLGTSLVSIAARPNKGGALEAPFIVRRCGYYYLFVSWDSCCKGVDSTYNTRVGRSTAVAGPYLDRDGVDLRQGGGTLVVAGDTRWKGPGHNAVIFTDDAAYNIYHAYDADKGGAATLRIAELVWDDEGWPISGGP